MSRAIARILSRSRDLFETYVYTGRTKSVMDEYNIDRFLVRIYNEFSEVFDSPEIDPHEITREFGDRQVTFIVDTATEQQYVQSWGNTAEKPVIEDLLAEIESGEIFYDVGAHLGLYACVVGQTNKVVCFEPHPENSTKLSKNLQYNDVDASVFRRALGERTGEIGFEPHRLESGAMGGIDRSRFARTKVPVRTLDGTVESENLPLPNIIKVDINGEEMNFLEGGRRTLSDPTLRVGYFEIHPSGLEKRGTSENAFIERLKELGFTRMEYFDRDEYTAYRMKAIKEPS